MKKVKDGEKSGKLNSLENKRILDYIKAVRKKSREEEIQLYGKPLPKTKIKESKKRYIREIKNDCIRFSLWWVCCILQ